jgi:4-diphosphocytidyl-2-C-methyl-D-erythritol kinase
MITNPNVKINLGLNVLRKRPDGYHDIETLFVPYFDIHDTLEIVTGDDYSQSSAKLFARYSEDEIAQGITQDGKLMITIARSEGVSWDPLMDLTSKAYMLLASDFKMPPVKIFLEKTSPVGAGLGGGSSDAAFALKMFNEMFSLNLSDITLADYASRLGSDCAFFIYNKPMLGTGRGEVLTPFDLDLGDSELKVLVPEGVAVSTAEAYSGIVPKEPVREISDILKLPIGQWKDLLVNDFEATVFVKHPELAAIKTSLYESGAVYASMSGSGSAVFGIYK